MAEQRRGVTLIGMPGAGTSTVGVLLSKRLALAFVDSDLAIQVREGRTLLVTDRGEPIAELRPLPPSVPAALLKLSNKGAVTLPVRKAMGAFRPIRSRGRALSEAVLEDREDRF